MPITGPKLQVPTPLTPMMDETGVLHPDWTTFFHTVQQTAFNVSRSGPTASRPTGSLDGRYIGMNYFDTTLSKPIYLVSTSPVDIWKDASGVVV